jgi:prepilin-type N-terminal cleavage/methylation domain-containing protein
MKNQKGFTLIELLVVISIISLIANIGFATTYSARILARDAVRLADLKTFEKGLALFYEKYGVYPCGSDNENGPSGFTRDSSGSCSGDSQADVPGFLNGCDVDGDGDCDSAASPQEAPNCHEITPGGLFSEGIMNTNCPKDPINQEIGGVIMKYRYAASRDGQFYVLGTYLEANDELMLNDTGFCVDAYEVGNGLGMESIVTINHPGNSIGPSGGC